MNKMYNINKSKTPITNTQNKNKIKTSHKCKNIAIALNTNKIVFINKQLAKIIFFFFFLSSSQSNNKTYKNETDINQQKPHAKKQLKLKQHNVKNSRFDKTSTKQNAQNENKQKVKASATKN